MAHGAGAWLPFVQPFGTVLIGLGAFALAYRQWLTANEKLKLDLYDRRDRLLDRVLNDYLQIFRDGVEAQDELRSLYANLLRLETVFQGETTKISINLRTVVGRLIGIRKDSMNDESAINNFQRIVDQVPILQNVALNEMRVFVPRPSWLPFRPWRN